MAKTKKEKRFWDAMEGIDEVAHELRTPLVSVQGYLEMMLKEQLGPLNEEQLRGIQIALRNCERLRDYINELVLAMKQDAG